MSTSAEIGTTVLHVSGRMGGQPCTRHQVIQLEEHLTCCFSSLSILWIAVSWMAVVKRVEVEARVPGDGC